MAEGTLLGRIRRRLVGLHDRFTGHERVERIERLVLLLAVLGLMVHLGLIAISRQGLLPPGMGASLGKSYLAALYTPFSFILFFEVFLLVLSLPASLTGSLGKQYEIVSLIILRSVFKDVARFENLTHLENDFPEFQSLLLDMGGGVAMFLLVSIFYHVSQRRPQRGVIRVSLPQGESWALLVFIDLKKILAMGLAILLFAMATYHLVQWSLEAYGVIVENSTPVLNVHTLFYVDLFTVMIFVDVFVLILSMWRDDAYHMVFRNAGYVISTILLRFSLSIHKPYNVELALLAVAFGIAIAGVHRYWVKVHIEKEPG